MKYIYIIFAVLIAIPVFAYLAGLLIPESHSAAVSRDLPATRVAVWEAITNVEQYSEWRSDVRHIELLNDSTQRLTWRELYSDNDPITFTEVERIDTTLFTARIANENLPFGSSWTYELEENQNGVNLTITENGEIYNPVFRFVSAFVIGYTATITRYMNDLEHYAQGR